MARSKWSVSNEAWRNNIAANKQRYADEGYDTSFLDDAINKTYQGGPSKYYFRNDDRNKEYENLLNNALNQYKSAGTDYLNKTFGGYGTTNAYLDDILRNNFDSSAYVDNFISDQYNDALSSLDKSYKRGTLSDTAYNNAIKNLNKQKSAAYSTVIGLTGNLGDQYKTDLSNLVSGYATNLSSADTSALKSSNRYWNPSQYGTEFNTALSEKQNQYQNDLDAATLGLNLFDTSDLIGNARVNSGVSNTQSNELISAIEDNTKKKQNKVGLGNQGVF